MTTKTIALASVEAVKSRKVANNTYEWFDNKGNRHIRLHMTDIVTFKPNGDIVLNSGGWRTVTTKARMNHFARVRIYSDRGTWYVQQADSSVPFVDGMVLPNGKLPKLTKTAQATVKREAKLKAAITKFVAGLDKLDTMPIPDGGDCWLCIMPHSGTEHLRQHIRENYLHGTLLFIAYRATGRSEFAFAWAARRWGDSWSLNETKRALRNYMKREFGLS